MGYTRQENDLRSGPAFVGKGLPTYAEIFFWNTIEAGLGLPDR